MVLTADQRGQSVHSLVLQAIRLGRELERQKMHLDRRTPTEAWPAPGVYTPPPLREPKPASMTENRYTDEIIQRATALREAGMKWTVVCERLGVPEGSFRVVYSRRKRGEYGGRWENLTGRLERCLQGLRDGKTLTKIAEEEGVSVVRICGFLDRQGYDAEVRGWVKRGEL